MGLDYQVTVNVFVGSPNNIEPHRRSVVEKIQQVGQAFADRGIVVKPFDYCDVYPEIGNPQDHINESIGSADLVIILVGNRLGNGTRQEIEFAARQRERGELQTAMVYVQRSRSNGKVIASSPGEQRAPFAFGNVAHEIEAAFPDRFLFHYFTDFRQLMGYIDLHVQEWLRPLKHIPRFMKRYEGNIDSNLVKAMRSRTPVRNDEIVMLEMLPECDKRLERRTKHAFKEYARASSPHRFAADPVRCYLVAKYLYRRILSGDPHDFRHRPFVNPIHQQLAALIRSPVRTGQYSSVVENLTRWLTAKDIVYPVARDFAAFVLGMVCAESARFELLRAIADKTELPAVRTYAAMSLGMINQRDTMDRLIEIHDAENDLRFQFLLAHVILLLGGILQQGTLM